MRGGVTAGVASVTPLLSTPTLSVGEFHCPPGDASWRETNRIGDRAHLVFPRRSVLIRQLGREPVLATANHTMLYNADQRYRRELHHELGDDSVFVELPEETLEQLAGDGRLHGTHVPAGRRTYLLQHLLVRQLRGHICDELEAEELASRLVLSALASQHRSATTAPASGRAPTTASSRRRPSPRSPPTSPCGGRSASLPGRSTPRPFHLARVFRAETGFTLAGYRQALRLRAALERLPGNDRDLSALALELGFSSHSHFTATFTREFGVPPSAVKDPRRIRALLDAA